jgi:2-C-methyl-D-erythritol 4-phosphate cytidylyltransferase
MSATSCVPSLPDVGVVIVAAGRGARLGGDVPKQFLPLAGVPMLLRSMRPFTSHPDVLHTVLVLPADVVKEPPAWLAPHLGANLTAVAGGAERSDSVAAGLAALPSGAHLVLVHDAARPLASRALLDRVIGAARTGAGAVPVVPVADTIKQLDAAQPGMVVRTVPREQLVRAQTPQAFPRRLLEEAHAQARRGGVRGTDDAALLERMGAPVVAVPGDPANLKVTDADDLALAEWLLLRDQ